LIIINYMLKYKVFGIARDSTSVEKISRKTIASIAMVFLFKLIDV